VSAPLASICKKFFTSHRLATGNNHILPSSPSGLGDEKLMYSLLEALGATVISVGNRPSLLPFHTRVLRLKGDGAWAVETPDEAAANAE
jgi:hypothetical protein